MGTLNGYGSAVVDGNGRATVSLGPTHMEAWHLTRVTVTVEGSAAEPTARVYLDTVAAGSLVAGTYSGSLDSSDESLDLRPGQLVICQWDGADPGATATLSVFGTRTDTRRGA